MPVGRASLRSLAVVAIVLSSVPAFAPAAEAAPSSDLSITIADAPDPVAVGADLHYTLTAATTGPDDAAGVTVHDVLPAGVSFGGATPSQGTCVQSAGVVDCTLGTVSVGSAATVDLLVAPLAHGTLEDDATATSATSDPDPTNDSGSEQTTAQGPDCTMVGTWGNDVVTGTAGNDVLCGLGGDDTLAGRRGDDVLIGGSGEDFASYANAPRGVRVDLATGVATGWGHDTLLQVEDVTGSPYDDVLRGDAGSNVLNGLGGNDLLESRGGDDTLQGGTGDDFLSGGGGVDHLTGGGGTDTCLAGPGGGSADCLGRIRPDPKDTRGTFDVSRVAVLRSGGFAVRIRTFARWSVAFVWDKGYLDVSLDTEGGAGADYEALIRSDGTRMRGLLFRAGARFPIRALDVRRLSSRSVLVRIPLGRLTFGRRRWYLRWSVESIWNAGPCTGACLDRVPDTGSPPEPRS